MDNSDQTISSSWLTTLQVMISSLRVIILTCNMWKLNAGWFTDLQIQNTCKTEACPLLWSFRQELEMTFDQTRSAILQSRDEKPMHKVFWHVKSVHLLCQLTLDVLWRIHTENTTHNIVKVTRHVLVTKNNTLCRTTKTLIASIPVRISRTNVHSGHELLLRQSKIFTAHVCINIMAPLHLNVL